MRDFIRPSFVVGAVFWPLAVVAGIFGLATVGALVQALRTDEVDVMVAARTVTLDFKPLEFRRGQQLRLVAIWDVALEDRKTGRRAVQTYEEILDSDDFASYKFLDAYQPGSLRRAAVAPDDPGRFDLDPSQRWSRPFGLLIAAWMFGVFAWFIHPMVRNRDPGDGIFKKFLAMAGLIVFAVVLGVVAKRKDATGTTAKVGGQRAPVQGFIKTQPISLALAGLRGRGVQMRNEPGIAKYVGDLRFCEYMFGGKAWRSTSLYCQPPENEACPGTVDPANPRDVKWKDEP